MTEESMRLIEVVQKSDDGDFLKMIAETALQRIMDADVDSMIGATRYERNPEQLTYWNGYRERSLETLPGTMDLKVPPGGACLFPAVP